MKRFDTFICLFKNKYYLDRSIIVVGEQLIIETYEFTRSFTLPSTVNTEDIKADYQHGVLKVRLAKRSEAKPKQIKVNIGTAKPVEGQKVESQAQAKSQVA